MSTKKLATDFMIEQIFTDFLIIILIIKICGKKTMKTIL